MPIDDFTDRRDPTSVRLADVMRSTRLARELTTSALAKKSGVSRGMIAKVESGECSPTAALLGRLSGALGTTMSELIARAEDPERESAQLLRASEQRTWVDPASGERRRVISPASGGSLQLAEHELPPGSSTTHLADEFAGVHQQLWVLAGQLEVRVGARVHALSTGDSLEFGLPRDCVWTNPHSTPCRYLVAVGPRRA